ncbi:MAG TPA: BREX-1 system phosphatase PglZ type A [Clostridiaceae bacterium]|nr:BREX-1 system phosphatase PglZ type A [Clostridiaceae bacterium]
MELNEIKKVLEESFKKGLTDGRKRNIIFWYDENREFVDDIDGLGLSDVKILKLDGNNYFYAKYKLEKADTDSNYLVYAPFAKPNPRDNYLLDVLKYSTEFTTDKATVIMRDMNIHDDSLKSAFKKYIKFFNNKDRLRLFKSYNLQDLSFEKIDIAVVSALCHLQYPDMDESLRAIFSEGLNNNRYYEDIEKFGDASSFWSLVEKHYGYRVGAKSLKNLIIMFMVTYTSGSLLDKIPENWKDYISPKKADCIVFLSSFMNSSNYVGVYNRLADYVQEELNAKNYVSKWDIDKYINCDAFRCFDEAIINKIKEKLLLDIGEFPKYKEIIQKRRTKHWYNVFKHEYDCIFYATELLEEWKKDKDIIKEYPSYGFFNKYTEELYRMDTCYRKFYISFDSLKTREGMIDLKETVENTYVNGYLNSLSVKWSDSLEELNGKWNFAPIVPQTDFYKEYIRPYIDKGERAFVIISDGLRYEAAKEFCDILNNERKGSAQIAALAGVIPSVTKLGMASLLPHNKITVDRDFEVYVDGIDTEGTSKRNKILLNCSKNSIAIQYDSIVDMKRDGFRETFGGKDIIYIYHNNIDARGDNSKTEREVFEAVEETFEELKSLINSLVNNVSAVNIYIVADHGFIYKRGSLTESDKVQMAGGSGSLENRRYILSFEDMELEGTLKFDLGYLTDGGEGIKYITPRGANRFKVQGSGSNYVHGGTSLQEIVVPVIKFKSDRRKSSKNGIKKVDLRLTNISRRITNSITSLEFFQTEKVQEKMLPRRLRIYFADEDGNKISNENIVIADSKSGNPSERIFKQRFVLKNMKYERNKKYYLVFENEDEVVEKIYDKIPFVIDIAFANNDFGF